MAMVKRNRSQQSRSQFDTKYVTSTVTKRSSPRPLCSYFILAFSLVAPIFFLAHNTNKLSFGQSPIRSSTRKKVETQLLYESSKYNISINFNDQVAGDVSKHEIQGSSPQQGDDDIVFISSLGPHNVSVQTQCAYPSIWMRVVGDGLIPIILQRRQEGKYTYWDGEFTLLMEGEYTIEDRWYGCNDEKLSFDENNYESTTGLKLKVIPDDREVSTRERIQSTNSNSSSSILGSGSWISAKKILTGSEEYCDIENGRSCNDYIWANSWDAINKKLTLLNYQDDGTSQVLAEEGTISSQHRFYSFRALTNYELVCWIGSKSAKEIHSAFLALRPLIFSYQRPFKFHYYEVTNLVHPDAEWTKEYQGFSKCKHVLVSIDEIKNIESEGDDSKGLNESSKGSSLSQEEFKTQIKTFINNIIKTIDDDEFPIWVFTTMQPPMEASNCYREKTDGNSLVSDGMYTTEHPCNTALKELFNDGNIFPSRVKLMDNTDLSWPQWDRAEHSNVVAMVALRIFVLVGYQVTEWRSRGMKGTVKGFYRNGTLEPNIPFSPWRWD